MNKEKQEASDAGKRLNKLRNKKLSKKRRKEIAIKANKASQIVRKAKKNKGEIEPLLTKEQSTSTIK